MNDALCVGGSERFTDLQEDILAALPREQFTIRRDLAEQAMQVFALEVLHREEDKALTGYTKICNVDDVLIPNTRSGLRLLQKALDQLRLARKFTVQDLQSHSLVERDVTRGVDRAHTSLAQSIFDEIAIRNHMPHKGRVGVVYVAITRHLLNATTLGGVLT